MSHVHLPAVIVQSHAPSGDLFSCAGHATVVSSQRSSSVWRNDHTGVCGNPMGHVSSVNSTWCGPPPGLVGSQLLGGSQIRRSSACGGTEAHHAQSLMTIHENCPSCPISHPLSRRQALVESESLSDICAPVPSAKADISSKVCNSVRKSRGAGTQSCASSRPARWQRGGQRAQRRAGRYRCRSSLRWLVEVDTTVSAS